MFDSPVWELLKKLEIKSVVKSAPHAIGLNRTADNEKEPT